MSDFLGPADAPNAVAIRPSDTRSFPTADTWFRDCSTATADDGTDIQAAFLNSVAAAMRAVARVNGGTAADPTIKIVPENGLDDNLLIKAIQHLLQRGQPSYAADTGSVNALSITLSPTPPELKSGMTVRVKVAHTVTGASTLTANGFSGPIVHPDGSPTQNLDLVTGEVATFNWDGSRWQKVGLSGALLTASRDYYVNNSTGSDTANDGLSAGAPFATIQHALDVTAKFNMNGFNVTIHVADGTYNAPVWLNPVNGQGSVIIIGNVANPANCIVNGTSGSAFQGIGRGYTVTGFTVTGVAVGADPGCGFYVGGAVNLGAINFGTATLAHVVASGSGATVVISGPIKIVGSAQVHLDANLNGTIVLNTSAPPALTIVNPVVFSEFFIATQLGVIAGVYSSITGAGNVSGIRYVVSLNGVISVNGSGVNYLPGTSAGLPSTGGQYL
jgi:hypothetical protein